MPSCFLLTADQLAAKLAQGFTLVGGPFPTEANCTANCGSSSSSSSSASPSPSSSSSSSASSGIPGTIPTSCCPGTLLPVVLHGTISNKTGDCTCLPNTVTFNYNVVLDIWIATFTECGGCSFNLACNAGTWTVDTASCIATSVVVSVTCSPLQIVFDCDTTGLPICTGQFRLTVTL